MTEHEWRTCAYLVPMLKFLRGRLTTRKSRLFAVACARRVTRWMDDERSLKAIDVSELYAEQLVGKKRLAAARHDARSALDALQRSPSSEVAILAASTAFHACAGSEGKEEERMSLPALSALGLVASLHGGPGIASQAELAAQTDTLRDLVGNPFRPVTVAPAWLTTTVTALAAGIYADRAFDRLPILADALEEAGCDNADVLTHCRAHGPHVRGCWVVDLVLGQS